MVNGMERWTKEQIWAWWDGQKWPVGANYVTSDAVNDIEMWMDATFNAPLIQKELNIAAQLGLNSVRVFLSYLVWAHEGETFLKNFETFLSLAAEAGLTVMPILFDDCAFDFGKDPEYGPQPAPVPGVHNSRWVPSPGFALQDDPEQLPALQEYVQAVVGAHREDLRILVWDLYNEPGNSGRRPKALPLLQHVFAWARACDPVQPLTAGAWRFTDNAEVEKCCVEQSDIISFHAYTPMERTQELLQVFESCGRPMLITEWLHRPNDNMLLDHLPLFHERKIGAWQWGMILGKTQTNLNWATMNGGVPEPNPALWQHDLLYPDGSPYCQAEIDLIAKLIK